MPEAPGERLNYLAEANHIARPARQDLGQLHEGQAVRQVPQRPCGTGQPGGPIRAGESASGLRPGPVMHRASEQRDTEQATVTELLGGGDRELNQLLPTLEIAGEAGQPAADTKQ